MIEKIKIKRIYFILPFLLSFASIACLPTKAEKEAIQNRIPIFLDKEFTLKVGQTGFFELQKISITFNNVISDSRCPSDVVCIWAGDVQIDVSIKIQELEPINIIMTDNKDRNHYEFFGLDLILLKVEPYPISNKRTPPSNYTAKFIIREIKDD